MTQELSITLCPRCNRAVHASESNDAGVCTTCLRSELRSIAIGAIATLLDAAVASCPVSRPMLAFLPNADDFPIVDQVVRHWATSRGATVTQRSRHVTRENGTGVETYRVFVGDREVVTVHVPQQLQEV